MALAESGGVLPRRQDLPEEAFLSPAQLRRIEESARLGFDGVGFFDAVNRVLKEPGVSSFVSFVLSIFRRKRNPDALLPIISVSYCWLEAAHPDREGRQLQLLCRKLRSLYGGRGLHGACYEYGFSDMGVFLDWCSGYQKDPALFAETRAYGESRSGEEKAAFGRMLENTMDLWYAHASITVVLITQLPDELPAGIDRSRTYDTRGWTTFERCSAELAHPFTLHAAGWKLVIDLAGDGGGAQRRLPTTPARMATLLAGCRFTNGADSSTVLSLYEKTAKAVLGTVENVQYIGLPLARGDAWTSPALLADALNYCESLRDLSLMGNRLDDEGVAELAAGLEDGALPALEGISLAGNRFGALGVGALCDVFPRRVAPMLSLLAFSFTPFGDDGAVALATALAMGALPAKLTLSVMGCDMGDEGALAIAAALPVAGPGQRIISTSNRTGLAGQSALLEALEAKHGTSFRHYFDGVQMNALPWTPLFVRAMIRGLRRKMESGRFI